MPKTGTFTTNMHILIQHPIKSVMWWILGSVEENYGLKPTRLFKLLLASAPDKLLIKVFIVM